MGEQRFKVGDRVTNNDTTRVDVEEHWNTYFRRSQGEIIDGALVVASVSDRATGSDIGLSNKVGSPLFYMPESTLKFAKPATLKIEAGRFYKTRDGRKVGPMVVDNYHDRDYGWTVEHEFNADFGKAWRSDGTFHVDRGKKHNADIVAEWIDEPVTKPSNDNAKPNFKVGDLVRHKSLDLKGFVKEVIDAGTVRTHWPKVGWGGADPIDSIELITTPTTAIVALIENGQPKPSSTPHVHTSTGAAEKEAKRLATKYKGKQFGVFTLTATHEEAAPVYDHKWQNMAYLGLKIDAIKELRAVAGLTLKGAKDAVEAWIEYENAA